MADPGESEYSVVLKYVSYLFFETLKTQVKVPMVADEKIVQRVLRHTKVHVTKDRYIKAFDLAVPAAMKRMETTLDAMKLCAPTVHQIN